MSLEIPDDVVLLGEGVLGWHAEERRSDRYGSVKLFPSPQAEAPIPLDSTRAGMYGRLLALVMESRRSTHIGDLFWGICPMTPDEGDWIILGEGILFVDGAQYGAGFAAGLQPIDGRATQWLQITELYKAVSQTVRLYFQPVDGGSH